MYKRFKHYMRTRPPYDTAAMAAMVAEQRDNLMPWLAVIRLAAHYAEGESLPSEHTRKKNTHDKRR